MDESVMGTVPAFVLGSLSLTLSAVPLLPHPVIAMEKGFDGIADLQFKSTQGPCFVWISLSAAEPHTGQERIPRIVSNMPMTGLPRLK